MRAYYHGNDDGWTAMLNGAELGTTISGLVGLLRTPTSEEFRKNQLVARALFVLAFVLPFAVAGMAGGFADVSSHDWMVALVPASLALAGAVSLYFTARR